MLQDLGYSFDFLGLPNLQLPQASVSNGRLNIDGPAYKALIIDQSTDTHNDAVNNGEKSKLSGL